MALLRPLNTNERAEMPAFTHVFIVTANDLTQTTAATAQTFNVCGVLAGDILYRAIGVPVVPFQVGGTTPDAAFNSDTVSFGDTGSVARHLAATEANANGTFLRVIGNTVYLYPAADTLQVTVNSMAAKSLSNLNRGEYHVFFALCRSDRISNSIARTSPTKG
jgi:hypothetical protein